ncbi:hypothetical protein [Hymenobacter daeguensis]
MRKQNEKMYDSIQMALQFDIDVQHLHLTVEDVLSQYNYFGYYKGLLFFTKEYAPSIRGHKFTDYIRLDDCACFFSDCIEDFNPGYKDELLYPIGLLYDYLPNRKNIIDEILKDLES